MPALPLHEAGAYVAGAYAVLLGVLLLYVAIMAARLARIERDLGALDELLGDGPEGPARPEPLAVGARTEPESITTKAGAGTAP